MNERKREKQTMTSISSPVEGGVTEPAGGCVGWVCVQLRTRCVHRVHNRVGPALEYKPVVPIPVWQTSHPSHRRNIEIGISKRKAEMQGEGTDEHLFVGVGRGDADFRGVGCAVI